MKGSHDHQREENPYDKGDGREEDKTGNTDREARIKYNSFCFGVIVHLKEPSQNEDQQSIDQKRGRKIVPLRKKGSNKKISHAGQIVRPAHHPEIVDKPGQRNCLYKKQSESQCRIKNGICFSSRCQEL